MADAKTTPAKPEDALELTQEWDKVFPLSEKVEHSKVTFHNHFGITLAADLYVPRTSAPGGGYPAIAVSGPYGAVKEQSSGLYAQTMAENGFLAIAFDPSFTGESGGQPRYMSSPDINTEDFQAAVDYLSCRDDVDSGRVGIIGICGWGGIALNAAAVDMRIRATLASTMYDMTRVSGNGYFDSADNPKARNEARQSLSAQRTQDYRSGTYVRGGGTVDPTNDDPQLPQFIKEYAQYYRTPRGYNPRSLNSTDGWAVSNNTSWINARFLHYIGEIDRPVMVLHGEKAHSRYMGETAYKVLASGINPENKELVIVPGANHCDLYDGGPNAVAGKGGYIPWERVVSFFEENLA